jgi:peroxygenase
VIAPAKIASSEAMEKVEASRATMSTVAHKAPITIERKVPNDLDTKLPKPCK